MPEPSSSPLSRVADNLALYSMDPYRMQRDIQQGNRVGAMLGQVLRDIPWDKPDVRAKKLWSMVRELEQDQSYQWTPQERAHLAGIREAQDRAYDEEYNTLQGVLGAGIRGAASWFGMNPGGRVNTPMEENFRAIDPSTWTAQGAAATAGNFLGGLAPVAAAMMTGGASIPVLAGGGLISGVLGELGRQKPIDREKAALQRAMQTNRGFSAYEQARGADPQQWTPRTKNESQRSMLQQGLINAVTFPLGGRIIPQAMAGPMIKAAGKAALKEGPEAIAKKGAAYWSKVELPQMATNYADMLASMATVAEAEKMGPSAVPSILLANPEYAAIPWAVSKWQNWTPAKSAANFDRTARLLTKDVAPGQARQQPRPTEPEPKVGSAPAPAPAPAPNPVAAAAAAPVASRPSPVNVDPRISSIADKYVNAAVAPDKALYESEIQRLLAKVRAGDPGVRELLLSPEEMPQGGVRAVLAGELDPEVVSTGIHPPDRGRGVAFILDEAGNPIVTLTQVRSDNLLGWGQRMKDSYGRTYDFAPGDEFKLRPSEWGSLGVPQKLRDGRTAQAYGFDAEGNVVAFVENPQTGAMERVVLDHREAPALSLLLQERENEARRNEAARGGGARLKRQRKYDWKNALPFSQETADVIQGAPSSPNKPPNPIDADIDVDLAALTPEDRALMEALGLVPPEKPTPPPKPNRRRKGGK